MVKSRHVSSRLGGKTGSALAPAIKLLADHHTVSNSKHHVRGSPSSGTWQVSSRPGPGDISSVDED